MNIQEIKKRQNKLNEVSNILKEKFIGIDTVIDRIIDSISLWYIMPELQLRPPIIALWGITGIGKTDLIRTLVKHLGFNDKFVEIQMDDINRNYNNTIEEHLEDGGIETNEPAILLLDEIQRYRTIDEKKMMINNKSFNDIWTLLSDGKFTNNSKRKYELLEMFYDELYNIDRKENGADEEAETTSEKQPKNNKTKEDKEFQYQLSFWSAKRLKKVLKLQTPINELMKLKPEQKIELIKNTINDDNISVGSNYNKLLIVISGNLDEAFDMAFDVSNVDSDADIYHEKSKDINIIDIKDSLRYKFKPEQIARFGNNHIIYTLLSKQNYKDIIFKYSNEILEKVYADHKVKIVLTKNVYNAIYDNGVFPTQGVRPTISTIYSILGNNIPHYLFQAILNNQSDIVIDYNKNNKQLESNINGKTIVKDVVLDIDNIKNVKSDDEKSLVMVHELGHAIVYSNLFGIAPKQINVNSVSFSNGFILTKNGIENKQDLKNRITALLAGMSAEEIVFGENYKSTGASSDIQQATTIAARYVRKYAMNGTISAIDRESTHIEGVEHNYNINTTNNTIEILLTDEKKRATDIINKNLNILKKLIEFVKTNNYKISINDFVEIYNNHTNDKKIIIDEGNNRTYYDYDNKLKLFINKPNI